jgi:hypothetical protein
MGRKLNPIVALGLVFGIFMAAQANTKGRAHGFALQTKYLCQANGVLVRHKQKLVSLGQGNDEIQFVANAGRDQALTFGVAREYMIWPQVAKGTLRKSLSVLSRDTSGKYKVIQEVDMGETQKTKTSISLSVKDGQGKMRPVSCRIEMAWVKKVK